MGNRAVITTRDKKIGVYLHWHGGRNSVEGFLAYCKAKGYRPPEQDCYGWARLCQVVGNFFGGEASVGIDTLDMLDCDNLDNGTYIISNWEIVGRQYFDGEEQRGKDLLRMMVCIDKTMPEKEQLGEYTLELFLRTIKGEMTKREEEDDDAD